MTETILKVENLTVQETGNGKTILSGVSFEMKKNSIHALIGPNGSGKSTLAYALMGIKRLKIAKGKIVFLGKDIARQPTPQIAKMGITLAFQEPAYFDGISVRNYLKIGNQKLDEKELREIISLVGLDYAFLDRQIDHSLSGGERKRIELASVIAMKPKLIILDEPDMGLDIIIHRELRDILFNLKERTKASILLITHREETGMMAEKATLLWQGKVAYDGDFRKAMRKYCLLSGRKKVCLKSKI